MSEVKNILIVRTDRIGDVILTTPAVRSLKRAFPHTKVTILVTPSTKELVVGNPYIDDVLVDDRQGRHRGVAGYLRLAGELRRRSFDAAVVFHTKKRTNGLCFLAGIPRRIGYRNNKLGFLLTEPLEDVRHLGHRHEAEYCLDVMKRLGAQDDDLVAYLPLQPSAESWAEEFLRTSGIRSKNLLAVHPGASCPTKMWPAGRFAELIARVRERYDCRVILIGGANATPAAREIMTQAGQGIVDMTGKTGLSQLASLLKRCRMLVSNDSGPVHMAAAVGIGVVSIFTRNQPGINPERWRPLGRNVRVVTTPFVGEMSFSGKAPVGEDYLGLISTDAVLEAVDALYKLC